MEWNKISSGAGFLHFERVNQPENMKDTQPPCNEFCIEFPSCKSAKTRDTESVDLYRSGMAAELAAWKWSNQSHYI